MRLQANLLTECYVDTMVINILLGRFDSKIAANHKHGCNGVCQTLMGLDGYGIGVIDKDKRQHKYVSSFIKAAETQHIYVMKHTNRPHYIIQVDPAMDRFLLDTAKALNISPNDYNLPDNLTEFTRITKDIRACDNQNLIKFIKSLCNAEEMLKLKNTLHSILQDPYHVIIPE